MELSVKTKTYLVLGIMVCCFAVLYPKIFHPMLMTVLGMRQSQSGGPGGSQDWRDGGGVHPRLRMSGGPGARMAAEHAAVASQQQQQSRQSGLGGKGNVVGLILPVYAIGIVLYLVYTLVKVMGGFKSNEGSGGGGSGGRQGAEAAALNDYYKNFHFDPLSGEFVDSGASAAAAAPGARRPDQSAEERRDEQHRYERMHRDLEKLLKRVDDQDISENELVQLRGRLEETERQMTSILGAMQSLQQRQQTASCGGGGDASQAETRQRKAFSVQDGE